MHVGRGINATRRCQRKGVDTAYSRWGWGCGTREGDNVALGNRSEQGKTTENKRTYMVGKGGE